MSRALILSLSTVALAGLMVALSPAVCVAGPKKPVKVPKAAEIQKQMDRLFSGEVDVMMVRFRPFGAPWQSWANWPE